MAVQHLPKLTLNFFNSSVRLSTSGAKGGVISSASLSATGSGAGAYA